MIVAISRFTVRNGMEAEVREAFANRPGAVESVHGFLGLEVLENGPRFVLLTRWSDQETFRAWHRSPAHGTAHVGIPRGLKLDPSGTEVFVGAPIDGATSGGESGAMAHQMLLIIARLLSEGRALWAAQLDPAGLIRRATPGLARALGRPPDALEFASLLSPGSAAELRARISDRSLEPFLLQLTATAERASFRAFVLARPDGASILAAPPVDEQRALEVELTGSNLELAVILRENQRMTRELEATHRELRDAHWHLRKVSAVLPICMSCRAVKTRDDTWEDVAVFLLRSSNFLSHGYCAECAEKLDRAVEEGA